MGKIMHNKIRGMSYKAKVTLISLFTLLLSAGLYQGWQMTSYAAIGNSQAWSSVYSGTAFPVAAGYTYAVNAGTDRLLVVAVQSTVTAAATQTCSVTWGGKTLTQATGDGTTSRQAHTYLYYLKEADIAAATGTTLIATVTGGTTSYNMVRAAVYTGVDQSAPVKMVGQWTSSTTAATAVGPLSPTLTIATGEQAVAIVNLSRTGSTTSRTITPATPWTSLLTTATGSGTGTIGVRNYMLGDTTAASGVTCSYTASGTTLSSIAAMVISPKTSATLTVSGNTAIAPTGTRLDTDTAVVMQRVQVTGSGTMELNSLTLDDLGTTSVLASAEVYISPTSATVLPVDAVLVGSATNWAGTSTQFSLTGGTAANRTLGGTQPLTKYIYIVYDMSSGQASKTVRSSITAVGVVSPNVGATGLALNSNTITLDYSGNLLSTSANATGASNAKDSDAAVVMQHFKVDCNTAFDNALELNSITLQELGTTTQVSNVKIYVSTTEDSDPTKLPAAAKQVGEIADWNKASISIPLVNDFGANSADRTILAGTSKYLYVVYSMFYPDDADYVAGKTVQSKVTAVGTASPDTGVTGLNYLSNSITLTRGTWSRITSCGGCHDTANILDEVARNSTATYGREGRFPGSHYAHSNKMAYDCSTCHQKPTVYNHANGFINFSGMLHGDKYTRSTDNKVATSNSNTTFGTCNTTACHGQNSPVWGANTNLPQCQKCHADQNSATFYSNAIPQVTSPSDAHVGAHDAHLKGSSNYTAAYGCVVCHTTPATVNAAGHMDGTTQVDYPVGSAARSNGVSASYTAANGSCVTYCHGSGFAAASKGSNTAPTWANTAYLTGTPSTTECGTCHGFPPSTSDHDGLAPVSLGTCHTCHLNVNTDATFVSKAVHINGSVDSNVTSCNVCHKTVKSSYRRQIVGTGGDFDSTKVSHHVKNATDTVNDNSCSVCHDQTNHKTYSNGVSVYLKNLNTGTSVLYDGTSATAANLSSACSSCHDATHSTTTPFSDSGDNTNPPNINWTAGSAAHQTVNGCYNCHGNAAAANTTTDPTINGHSGSTAKMLRTLTNPYNATVKVNVATNYCYNCHGTTVANGATDAIQAQIAKTYGHKNVTCGDCHNMHAAKGGNGAGNQTAASGVMAGVLASASGVVPTYPGAGGAATPGLPGVTGSTLYLNSTTPPSVGLTATQSGVTFTAPSPTWTSVGMSGTAPSTTTPTTKTITWTTSASGNNFGVVSFVSPAMTNGATLSAQTATLTTYAYYATATTAPRLNAYAYLWNGTTKTALTTSTYTTLTTAAAANTHTITIPQTTISTANTVLVVELYATSRATGAGTVTVAYNATGASGTTAGPTKLDFAVSPTLTWDAASSYASVTATQEYQICMKCHAGTNSSTGGGLITAPTGALAFTDLSLEFNPNNRSGHPVATGLNNYPNSLAPKALTAAKMKAPWNVNLGTQVMTCSDCHATDTAASKGPHGSAVKWMLAGTNKAWPYTTTAGNGTGTGTAFTVNTYATGNGTANGLFCLNCHTVTGSNSWHLYVSSSTHSTNAIMSCVSCHIRVPHGGKISRLLQAGTATTVPARYRSNGSSGTPNFLNFGTSSVNIKGSSYSGNFKSSCSQHSGGGTGGEAW
ncbi:MAG: hypothetical protein WCP20_14610 [Desulfuromonadales bacterium]